MEGTSPCLICYRRCSNKSYRYHLQEQENVTSAVKLKRFFHLLERHLDQNKSTDGRDKVMLENLINAGIHCCEDCSKVVESFCDLYHQLKSIELLLNWKVQSLENIMLSAHRIPARMKDFKNRVKELDIAYDSNEVRAGEAIELFFNFKWELFQKCKRIRLTTGPRLTLYRSQSQTELTDKPVQFDESASTSSSIIANLNDASASSDSFSPHPAIPISTENENEMENGLPHISIIKADPELDPLETLEESSPRLRKIYRCSTCSRGFSDFSKLEKHQLCHGNDDWFWSKPDSTCEEERNGDDDDVDDASNYDCNDSIADEELNLDCKDDIEKIEIAEGSDGSVENRPSTSGRLRGGMKSRIRRRNLADRKLKCRLCGREFASVSNHNRHHRDVHLRIKAHKCQTCSRSFKRRQCLARHYKESVDCVTRQNPTKKNLPAVETETNLNKVDAASTESLKKYAAALATLSSKRSYSRREGRSFKDTDVQCSFNPETEKHKCNLCGKEYGMRFNFFRHHREVHLRIKTLKRHKDQSSATTNSEGLHLKDSHSFTKAKKIQKIPDFDQIAISEDVNATNSLDDNDGLINDSEPTPTSVDIDSNSCDVDVGIESDQSSPAQVSSVIPSTGMEKFPSSINPVTGKHKCSLCEREYGMRFNLFRHHREIHLKVRPYKCQVCGQSFRWNQYLQRHLSLSANCAAKQPPKISRRYYRCHICGKGFDKLYHLKSHLKAHSSTSSTTVEIDNRSDDNDQRTEDHELSPLLINVEGDTEAGHGLSEKYSNSLPPSPGTSTQIEKSKSVKSPNIQCTKDPETDKLRCSLCSKEFSSLSNYNRHQNDVHLRVKRFKCQFCNLKFLYKCVLLNHLKRTNSCAKRQANPPKRSPGGNKKSRKCLPVSNNPIEGFEDHAEQSEASVDTNDSIIPTVRKSTSSKVSSNRPKRSYERLQVQSVLNPETGRFKCTHCPKEFNRDKGFKVHYMSVHLNRKWTCNLCGKAMGYQTSYKVHMKTVHQGVKYKCKKCHYPFSQRSCLRLHLRTTSCGEGEEAKPPVLHKCDFCEKEFYPRCRLTYHMQSVHLKEREHLCSECGKEFMQKSSLRRHMISVHSQTREHLCDLCGKEFKCNKSLKEHYVRRHQQK